MNLKTNGLLRLCFACIVLILPQVSAQSNVPYPAWTATSFPSIGYLPTEYAGTYPSGVRNQLWNVRRMRDFGTKVTLISSPTSGVIAVRDWSATPIVKKGWDTSKSRVYYMNRISDFGVFPSTYHCIVWNSALKRSEVIRLSIDANCVISQSLPIARSETNQIWGACGVVGQKLYVYDLSSRSFRRVLDVDQDGDFELLDTSFNIPIATVWKPDGSFASAVARSFIKVKSFVESPTAGSIARVVTVSKGYDLDIFESGGIGSISLQPNVTNPIPFLKIVGALVIGQQRVLVSGTPGTSFKIYQVDSAGQSSEVSGVWTISASGQIRVDLKSPYLVAGSKVHAMTMEGGHKSADRAPLLQTTSSLLPPTSVLLEEGKRYVFHGDRLKANQQAFCILADGTSIPLVTKWLRTTREIDITMPDLGTPGVTGPFNKLALVSIGLKNATTGVANTQPVAVSLFYQ